MLRREWRQHVLVVTLLSVAVAAALFGAAAAHGVTPSHDGRFGLAGHRFEISGADPDQLDEFVADADDGSAGSRSSPLEGCEMPGTTERMEIGPRIRLEPQRCQACGSRRRYPVNADEVALTDGAAQLLGLSIGDTVELEGQQATVVGQVENPDDLDEELVLAAPSAEITPDAYVILIRADEDRVHNFRSDAAPSSWNIEQRGQSKKTLAAIGVLITSTVAMLLVTLVAAAAFVVIAQRRQRQLGLWRRPERPSTTSAS